MNLHHWCTPPIEEIISHANSHAANLPDDLVIRKLESLTTLLQTTFGLHPYSYRVSRYASTAAEQQRLMERLRICLERGQQKHNATLLTMRDNRKHLTGTA